MTLPRRPAWLLALLALALNLGVQAGNQPAADPGQNPQQPAPATAPAAEPINEPVADPADDIAGFSEHLADIADHCRQATVGIVIPGGSMGSGVIVSDDGLVMTAAHVLPEAGGDVVIVTADGKQHPGKALGVNRKVDSGFAKITQPGTYHPAEVAEAGTVWEGDWCVAFGHGGGVQTDRPAPMRLGRILHVSSDTSVQRWITTDCTVISGDSGGPLFNTQGRVIGIHSNIGMSVLVNRHVPISAYHAQWEQLLEPTETNEPPAPAQPLIPGLEALPDGVEREIARRLKDGDEQLREQLEAHRDDSGKINASPEQIAEMLGHQGVLDQINNYREKLEARKQKTDEIENAGEDKSDKPDSEVARRSAETRQMILDKLRERALENIAEDLRKTHGKISDQVIALFEPAVGLATEHGPSTCEVISRGRVVALGTVVRKDGYIVTKASELAGPARVRLAGQEYPARVVNGNGPNDLALLKIDADNLAAVRWAKQPPLLGSLLVVPDPAGKPLAMGVVGVNPRPIPERVNNVDIPPPPKPFLGVADLTSPDDGNGVKVGQVPDQGPAKDAGVQADDVITAINGDPINDTQSLVQRVTEARVGEELTLTIQRGEESLDLTVKLGSRPAPPRPPRDDKDSAAQVYSARGGKLSNRRTNFPLALTHDAIIWATDIGGPVLNLEGEAIGLNIARYGRTATYALPADHVKQAIEVMMRGK